jgi:acyl-CoA dehydrogenase
MDKGVKKMSHWIFTEEHEMFRHSVRKFVEKELTPFAEEWEMEGIIPRQLYKRMGELGFLGIKFPIEYGGSGLDYIMDAVLQEELMRCGVAGVAATIGAHTGISLTQINRFGNDDQKKRYLAPGITGEKIGALAITESNTGSDVSAVKTQAKREGDHYILNGSKMFITNGISADFVVVLAATEPSQNHKGLSLFVVDTNAEGFSVSKKLSKLGWRSSDTAEIMFDEIKVPKENLLGEENKGFYYIMQNFQWERIIMGVQSVALANQALEASIQYGKERSQFGQALAQFQVLRHKIADMAVEIEKARNITYRALYLYSNGQEATTEATTAKAYAGEMVRRVTDQAIQIHGGAGYMMEYPVQRYWRDARIMSIGGGTTQIMNEILTKRHGIV